MVTRADPAWRLLEAVEILHAHRDGSFASRLTASTARLFAGAVYALDVFMPDGSHHFENNIQFDPNVTEIVRVRGKEILLRDHPVCAMLFARRNALGRLSDLVSDQLFRRTELFNEVYRPVALNVQMFATLPLPVGVGAISIDRDRMEFSDEDVWLIGHFVRHVQIAYATHLHLCERRAPGLFPEGEFRARLHRRGLTKREIDVLYWMSLGKRSSEIALILGISTRTAETHLANSYRKLNVDSRTAALAELWEICS